MTCDPNTAIPLTAAEKDCNRTIMPNDLDNTPMIGMTEDEKIDFVAARILKTYKSAFLELAK